jgi:hypothetical protein
MTRTFLPELQESDDESESYSASSSSPQSSPRNSFSSSSIRGSSTHGLSCHHRPDEPKSSTTKVLILGATSENGHEIIRQLYDHPSRPEIHAFVDESTGVDDNDDASPPALPLDLQVKCTSIVEGSVRHAIDLEEAIANTHVNWVVLCGPPLGKHHHHHHHHHRECRTMTAKNLATALSRPGFDHVRVMIVSRVGTKQCPFRSQALHRGVGGMFSLSTVSSILQRNQHDREEIIDCSGQEEALSHFLRSNNNNDDDGMVCERRLTIIRCASVVSSSSLRKSQPPPFLQNLVELTQSAPTLPGSSSYMRYTQRHDLASGVVDELCSSDRRVCRTLYFAARP